MMFVAMLLFTSCAEVSGQTPGPSPPPPSPPSPWGRRRHSPSPPCPPAPPGPLTATVYHMFEPKYTGLANKDAGDYDGEVAFIFLTFNPFEATNPEAAIGDNVFEMSVVNVTGWGEYAECNAPGCTGMFTCPANITEYCCEVEHDVYNPTSATLPGRECARDFGKTGKTSNGYWYSFPVESQGTTWTEVKVLRRIKSACLAEAWRADAGGCPDCQDLASQCTADCIKAALITDGDDSKLKATWDKVFSNETLCPNQPFPSFAVIV